MRSVVVDDKNAHGGVRPPSRALPSIPFPVHDRRATGTCPGARPIVRGAGPELRRAPPEDLLSLTNERTMIGGLHAVLGSWRSMKRRPRALSLTIEGREIE